MKTGWFKVFRDFRKNKTRNILAILAIAIGITGFASVLSTYSILTRELNAGYLATNPASATLWTQRIDEDQRDRIRAFSDLAQAEERRAIPARIRAEAGEWRNGILFVIKDYKKLTVSTLKPQKGKWPPSDGEILIERDAMGVANAQIGERLLVRMENGTEQKLFVSGTVHDAGQAQARMEQLVYGYITLNTLKYLGEDPYLDQWKVIVSGDRFNENHVRDVIARLRSSLETSGNPVRRLEIPKPGKHPHADLMGMLLIFKSTFGLFALILSGVLVMNLLTAFMAGQIRQIGIMKAIGAQRRQVMSIYLASVLLLSVVALFISIPLSKLAGNSLANFMARFLNFDLNNYGVASWVYALEIVAGLLVPILAALYPVWKGSRVTVREALADYGIDATKFGTTRTDRVIAKTGGIARPLLLSIRNTFRKRGRLALIVATMAAGGTIFIAAWNVRASLIHTVDVMMESFRHDLSLTLAEPYPIPKVEDAILKTQGIALVESWAAAEAIVIKENGSHTNPINIVAPAEGTKTIVFNIVEGRGLKADDRGALVINNALARQDSLFRVGNQITLQIGSRKVTCSIVGLARQPLAGAAAYANFRELSEVADLNGRTRNVRVITTSKDVASILEIRRNLERNLFAARIRSASIVSMAERRQVIDEHNSVIYMFLIIMSILIVVVGGLGLVTVMGVIVLERRREIGVIRAIGATRNQVLLLILAEGSFIGILSWILSVPLSALISNSLGNLAASKILRTHLESAYDPSGILIWLMIVLVFGAAASFFPAWNAAGSTVRELVEYE
jgi:putative ABC transport system permease protein